MTDDQNTSTDGPTRRSVLKRGTIAAAGVTVGIGAFSSTAAASACPRTPGYWKNHVWPDTGLANVNSHVPGVDFDNEEDAREFLREPKRGDRGKIMAFHLIATILNFQLSCESDVATPVADVVDESADPQLSGEDGWSGQETVVEIKRLAQDWLEASGWSEDNPQNSWIVEDALVEDGEVLKDLLDAYNNNTLIGCSCDIETDFDNVRGGGNGKGGK